MDRYTTAMNAFLAGIGSAFVLFPSGQVEQFAKREATDARIYDNFARVGVRLDRAMGSVRDEQKAGPKQAAK